MGGSYAHLPSTAAASGDPVQQASSRAQPQTYRVGSSGPGTGPPVPALAQGWGPRPGSSRAGVVLGGGSTEERPGWGRGVLVTRFAFLPKWHNTSSCVVGMGRRGREPSPAGCPGRGGHRGPCPGVPSLLKGSGHAPARSGALACPLPSARHMQGCHTQAVIRRLSHAGCHTQGVTGNDVSSPAAGAALAAAWQPASQ